MKIDRLLVSSSMIAAMCEKSAIDNLKLLEPFVIVCISDLFEPGEQIVKQKVLSALDQRFSLQEMPVAVLDKILFRIVSRNENIIKSIRGKKTDDRQFRFVQKPQNIITKFELDEAQAIQDTEDVLQQLMKWFNEAKPAMHITTEEMKTYIGKFFDTNGFDILFEIDELRSSTIKNTDAINYQIGRFILHSEEHDKDLFDKITRIAEGVMIAAAIYIDTAPTSKFAAQKRLAEVNVYLDTTFLLYALNYKTSAQKESADALLTLFRNNGANLYVFPQHMSEIEDILRVFRDRDGYGNKRVQSLERLEAEEYTSLEIDREIRNLEKSLKYLGISAAPPISYVDKDGNLLPEIEAYIDYSGLKERIAKKIPQYGKHPTMLLNDVDAISKVMVERQGMRYNTIESCPAIFITTNYSLVREGNQFLRYPVYAMQINPIMSDTDITTILWLKYGMKASDVPRLKLVEYARSAIAPSESVINMFYSITKRMAESGSLTEDEAADLRYSAYAKAEITAYCNGDASYLDDTSVIAIRDRVREKYTEDAQREVQEERNKSVALEHAAKRASEKAKAAQKEFSEVTGRIQDEIKSLYHMAENKAKRHATMGANIVKWAIMVLVVLLAIIAIGATIIYIISTGTIGLVYFIFAALSIISVVVLLTPIFSFPSRIYKICYQKLFDYSYSRNISKVEPQINKLQEFLKK